MQTRDPHLSRRGFLKGLLAAGVAPAVVPAVVLGKGDRPAPSNRIVMGAIGLGGRGTGDMGDFLGRKEVQLVAVCDVMRDHVLNAKGIVDGRYKSKDCAAVNDFREITSRSDIDAIMIGTPDHWHATISCDAMKQGKDVFCEKPETLTVREGQLMIETARRYDRIFSGGSLSMVDVNSSPGFKGRVKLVFVSFGSRELENRRPGGPFGGDPKVNTDSLKAAGMNTHFYISSQTAHEWQTWRRSLHEFAPLLFKD